MNLQELLGKLTPEDQQVVMDHFVQWLQGKAPQQPIVIRKTAKISTLGTEEEMRAEMARAFNMPIEKFSTLDVTVGLNKIRDQHDAPVALISPLLTFLKEHKATKDKFDEVYDLGKFLIAFESPFRPEIPSHISAVPDFILTGEGKRIGIEHTRVINTETKRLIGELQKILRNAEQVLLGVDHQLKQVINVSISYSDLNAGGKNILDGRFSIGEKNELAGIIASYIGGTLGILPQVTKPAFIEYLSVSELSEHPLNIVLNEHYLGKADFGTLLDKTIQAKEKKYSAYSRDTTLDEIWLLVIVSGVSGASSYLTDHLVTAAQEESKFDTIILFDNFSHEYFYIFQKAR